MPPIEWPSDAVVLLVGAASVGKSTWIEGRVSQHAVVSSDAIREMVAGDAAGQSANADTFRILHAIVRVRLKRGLLTVGDATNLTGGARRSLLTIAERAGRPARSWSRRPGRSS